MNAHVTGVIARPRLVSVACALALVCSGALGQESIFLSADAPSDPDGEILRPWDVIRHRLGFSTVLTIPGDPSIDALHRMDRPNSWLFSTEVANDIGGAFAWAFPAEPSDVVLYDPEAVLGQYSHFFCGGRLGGLVPPMANIDALSYEKQAEGTEYLYLSFDVPVELSTGSGVFFEPGDIVQYERNGTSCSQWSLRGLEFDASAPGSFISPGSNTVGAARRPGGNWLLSLDVPSDLTPSSGSPVYVPGQIALWSPANGFERFVDLQSTGVNGWSTSTGVSALSCNATPGRVPPTIMVDKSTTTTGDLTISWSTSCSIGGEDYGIYEGSIGTFYSHFLRDCSDDDLNQTEELNPNPGSRYYLVVPHNYLDEGSYGVDSQGNERPRSTHRCYPTQTLSPCPD